MVRRKLSELKENVKKAGYSGRLLQKAMPEAAPVVISEKVVSTLVGIFNGTVLIKYILDNIENEADFETLKILFALAIVINLVRMIFVAFSNITINRIDFVLEAELKKIAFRRVEQLTYSTQFNEEAKNRIYWCCSSIKGIVTMYLISVSKYISNLISFICSAVMGIMFGGVWTFVIIVLICVIEIFSQKKETEKNVVEFEEKKERNVFARKKSYFTQNVFLNKENNQSIRTEDNFDFFEKKYREYSVDDFSVIKKYGRKRQKAVRISESLRRVVIVAAEIVFLCYELLVEKNISVGSFWALFTIFESIRKTCPVGIYSEAQKMALYSDYLKEFFEKGDTEKSGTKHVYGGEYEIEFENVSYSYPRSSKSALKDVSFKFKSNETVVFLGENGTGKSTILLLLYRLASPQAGRITLNGTDISEYDIKEYRALFGTMFQDDEIFPMMIANNVSLLWNKYDEEKIRKSLVESGFGNRLPGLKRGTETSLTRRFDNDGFVPSGGEARKIVFARNEYTDAPIKFFDEYDSNIDPISEADLNDAIEKIPGTKLLITHRLPIAKRATNIIVMKDGTVAEMGNHKELCERGEIYRELLKQKCAAVTE